MVLTSTTTPTMRETGGNGNESGSSYMPVLFFNSF